MQWLPPWGTTAVAVRVRISKPDLFSPITLPSSCAHTCAPCHLHPTPAFATLHPGQAQKSLSITLRRAGALEAWGHLQPTLTYILTLVAAHPLTLVTFIHYAPGLDSPPLDSV